MAETRRRRVLGDPRSQSPAPDTREELRQVWAVAAAVVAAGALDETVAVPIVQGLEADLSAGSRPDRHPPHARSARRWLAAAEAGRAAAPVLPGGPVLAVPVGAAVPMGQPWRDGERDVWRLLALVLAPDRATLTIAARMRERGEGQRHVGRFGMNEPGGHPTATDDRGGNYRLQLSGGDSFDMTWSSGQFDLSPPVPSGARWLALSLAPGADPLRVDLTTARAPSETSADPPAPAPITPAPPAAPGATAAPASGAASGEHVLEAIAENMLWRSIVTGRRGDRPLTELAEMVAALETAGALEPGSPAVARLVALARRLGIGLPAGLTAVGPVDLPEPWTSVLTERDRRDGRIDVTPAAAVLPEIDGARFVLAGLHSAAESATLRVLAWGWAPYGGPLRAPLDQFVWRARDDAGRSHVAGLAGSGGSGQTDLYLTLVPPLHPAAASLEVTVTGRAGRVQATVPLHWQAVT